MTSLARLLIPILFAAATSCSATSSKEAPDPDERSAGISEADSAENRCASTFQRRINALLRDARLELDNFQTSYAKVLRGELDANKVDILPFCAMNTAEFTELRKYHNFSAISGNTATRFQKLRAGDDDMMNEIHGAFAGFQWGNRLFVSTSQSANGFLETVAHEVTHYLREAHLGDYKDPQVICIEESEAYRAEILLRRPKVTARESADIHAKLRRYFDLSKLRPDSCDYL